MSLSCVRLSPPHSKITKARPLWRNTRDSPGRNLRATRQIPRRRPAVAQIASADPGKSSDDARDSVLIIQVSHPLVEGNSPLTTLVGHHIFRRDQHRRIVARKLHHVNHLFWAPPK